MNKLKRRAQAICAMVASVAMVVYYTDAGMHVDVNAAEKMSSVSEEMSIVEDMGTLEENEPVEATGFGSEVKEAKETKEKVSYIVRTKTKKKLTKVNKKYNESEEINGNGQELMEDNKMTALELSGAQVDKLEKDGNIKYIEEDAMVSGSAKKVVGKTNRFVNKKNKHAKKEKRLKKNTSAQEWNVQMIKADKTKSKRSQGNEKYTKDNKDTKKIKIAILDSGVDAGNDINLAYSVSLVPGEEEMTPIFMDGTGHGSSVASLIAATDNGEGITGINPDAEIYSIRVLDDFNEAPLSRVIEGIYMAIDLDVNIINMSFGLDTYSEALQEAIQDAEDAGILVVAAAGNTGDEAVQYPAAYDEVMAVGSVDKEGEVAKDSAKGEEVEIVAPGEVVRTTGFVGTEEVVSGTSLAAPQIAAVASLVWEKDPSVSADFVRGLLNESANLYGDQEEYGNGLVDAEYALEHYDEYKEKYEENAQQITEVQKEAETGESLIPENESEITTFDETGCVEGSWSAENHVEMVAANYFNVRMGARLPDYTNNKDENNIYRNKSVTIDGKKYEYNFGQKHVVTGVESRKIAGVTPNPWWHGYYPTNYIKAVIYATRMANALGDGDGVDAADKTFNGIEYTDAENMKHDIKDFAKNEQQGWKYILAKMKKFNEGTPKAERQGNTAGFKRAIVWGMAIHAATDIYAHSAQIGGKRIGHTEDYNTNADNPVYRNGRYTDAQAVARQMMPKYISGDDLVARDLLMPGGYTLRYELMEYEKYMQEVDGSITYYSKFSSK